MELTEEEIKNFPAGLELNKLIAELVFGETVKTIIIANPPYSFSYLVKVYPNTDPMYLSHIIPNYSEEISAAMQLESETKLFDSCYLTRDKNYQIGHFGKHGFDEWTVLCEAETIPLVICRAVLLEWYRNENG